MLYARKPSSMASVNEDSPNLWLWCNWMYLYNAY